MSGWLPAREALFSRTRGADWQGVARLLAERVRIGRIEAEADEIVLEHEITGPRRLDSSVPPREMWAMAEVASWTREDWQLGTFRGATMGPGWSVVARGVRFDRAGVEAFYEELGTMDAGSPQGRDHLAFQSDRRRGGNPGKLDAWHLFWLEVVKLANDGALIDRRFQTQVALRTELLRLIEDGLSEEAIKPHVRRIWHAVVEPPVE